MGKRIAVLGSSGQIGSALVNYLAQRDKELTDDDKEGRQSELDSNTIGTASTGHRKGNS